MAQKSFLHYLVQLDRRWIFLVMGVAVMIPIVFKYRPPEKPTPLVQAVFDKIESLPPGSKVLLAFDFDPSSAPELEPMATAWTWHCAKKGHKLYFLTLWAPGINKAQEIIDKVIKADYPNYRYGDDYVYLGYRTGNEVVIKTITTNLKGQFTTDNAQTNINDIAMMRDVNTVRDVALILNASAGYPGTKEWVQYAAGPYGIPIASGSTGVQSPQLFPYIPKPLFGLLAAIKGAAEYEAALTKAYPEYAEKDGKPRPQFTAGIDRMGPQLIAHCFILFLIVLGNLILALQRRVREAV